jgi:Ca-activated chloride channel family protein
MRHALNVPLLAVGLLAVLGLALPAWAPALHAQDLDRVMFVSVLDKAGHPVAGLTPRDFTIREDGISREVLHVEPADDPITLAILVDTSQAATQYIQQIRPALEQFVKEMGGNNPIALVTFGDRPTIVVDYTTNTARLQKGIDRLFAAPQSGAYLLDTISEVCNGLRKRSTSRRVILAITTEGRDFSTPQPERVIDEVKAAGAALDVLVMGPPAHNILSESVRSRNLVIGRGTQETGGRTDHIVTGMALTATLGHIADDLTHQYRVTYARPETLIPPKNFSVSVNRPDLTARGTPLKAEEGRP